METIMFGGFSSQIYIYITNFGEKNNVLYGFTFMEWFTN